MIGRKVLVLLLALAALGGCVEGRNVEEFAKGLPEVQAFLAENPGAKVNLVFLNSVAVKPFMETVREDCGQQMQETPYWYVVVSGDGNSLRLYLDEAGTKVVCMAKPAEESGGNGAGGPEEEPEDECDSESECGDGNRCTLDSCKGTPKKCVNAPITSCETGDGCCPSDCNSSLDSDCTVAGECETNFDCDDGDETTRDVCGGTPKACSHTQRTCSQRQGYICNAGQTCSEEFIAASDSSRCCPMACYSSAIITIDPCHGTCTEDYRCIEGTCVLKTCSERGISTCIDDDDCCPSGCSTANDNDCEELKPVDLHPLTSHVVYQDMYYYSGTKQLQGVGEIEAYCNLADPDCLKGTEFDMSVKVDGGTPSFQSKECGRSLSYIICYFYQLELSGGEHAVEFTIDPTYKINETNESNNKIVGTVAVS